MTKHTKVLWGVWLRGLVGGVIGGAATAVTTLGGGQAVGATTFTVRQILTVAVTAGIVSAAAYLMRSPMPPTVEVDE